MNDHSEIRLLTMLLRIHSTLRWIVLWLFMLVALEIYHEAEIWYVNGVFDSFEQPSRLLPDGRKKV